MASALASQLSQIRAKSFHSLDLKAQKKAHSQSLLFEPRIAATQDFDTLYQLCYEGFVELCRLDPRFADFSGNIFSEQSKLEDRTLRTEAQNERLDSVLEDFLGLVGGRLLLKPALQAVEWTVRRFRVHEYNINYLIMTFLPYHAHPMFSTVLSLLPSNIPQTLKFLHPYIQSLSCPPRHTVVYTASHNQAFLAALSHYVIKVSRLGLQYPALLSFWASTTAEATALMLDQARSGRRRAQMQYQEDIIMHIMPILNDGLSIKGVSDLRIGCYMILTILASKVTLGEEALESMMSAVVTGWDQTSHAGLICLAVMAQKRTAMKLPKRVFQELLMLRDLKDDLKILKRQYRVDKLVLSFILGMVDEVRKVSMATSKRKKNDDSQLIFGDHICALLEADLLGPSSVVEAIKSILSLSIIEASENPQPHDFPTSMTDVVLRLNTLDNVRDVVQETVRQSVLAHQGLPKKLQALYLAVQSSQVASEDDERSDISPPLEKESFDRVLSRVEMHTRDESSFLSQVEPNLLKTATEAFVVATASPTDLSAFQDLPSLQKSQALTEPFFISFFIRIWCSFYPARVRAIALDVVSDRLAKQDLVSDVQFILPYMLYTLTDPSRKVRQAGIKLVLLLAQKYNDSKERDGKVPHKIILGQDQIYGHKGQSDELAWLSFEEAANFLNHFLVPNLEESLLDANHLFGSLAVSLNGGNKRSKASNGKDLKTSSRQGIFGFLCSHVTQTPLKIVKLRLLPLLNQVKKIGNLTRMKALMPLYNQCVEQSEAKFRDDCSQERIEPEHLMKATVAILSPSDRDGNNALHNAIKPGMRSYAPLLNVAAFQQIRDVWSTINVESQSILAETLLELSVQEADAESAVAEQSDASEILQTVDLPSYTLKAFLETLPLLINQLEDNSSAPKKRKTGHGQVPLSIATPQALHDALKRITFVLELVSACKPERHPELLNGLFQLLAWLKSYRTLSRSDLGYLEVTTLTIASAIIGSFEKTAASQIDRSAIRADVLVECVGATENPQVQQAALLLASNIASVAPELLLHHVMPLFTFAEKGIMRKNDEYSAHVIEKTMATVIPRLVESLHKRKVDPVISISELLLSFVAAYKDMPLQRRQDIFISLSSRIGAEEFLFALLVLLVNKYPDDGSVVDFATRLTAQQDCNTQLSTIEKYLDVLLDARSSKPALSLHLLDASNEPIANMLSLPTSVFRADNLKKKVTQLLNQEGNDAITVRSRYARILEQVFALLEKVQHDESLRSSCAELLDALLRLLSLENFVGTLPELLQRTESEIRINILLSLESRLKEHISTQKSPQTACLAFLPQLTSTIEESGHIALRQAAMTCIDQIVERFGKKDVSAVTAAATTICGRSCLEATDAGTQSSSLVCLATMVEVLNEAFIPMIPSVLPKAEGHLAASVEEDAENPKLHNAVYTFMTALLVYLPWMVHGAYLDGLLTGSYESANAEMGEDCDRLRSDVLQLLAKSIEPKECLKALDRTWSVAMVEGPLAAKEYLDILSIVIERQSKKEVAKQSDLLATLFTKSFNLRRVQCSPRTEDSYEDSEIEQVEAAVNETLIQMVYKLNDAIFRPIFIRFSDWANNTPLRLDEDSRLYRRITWWSFQLKFFGTLKSIVTSYAGLVLGDAVDILTTSSLQDADSRLLWQRVILTLDSAFKHDQDDFFRTPSHFAPVCESLISQLRPCAGDDLLPELIATITTLAATTDSPAQHKSLCSPLLQFMRDDSSAVKLAAVKCQLSLTERLGEEWLAQLPEMLPFISEGMEVDDEPVEMEVRKWVKLIEEMMGESIGPMLQ